MSLCLICARVHSIPSGAQLKVKNPSGFRPILVASTLGHLPTVRTLLLSRADPTTPGPLRRTPLHLACLHSAAGPEALISAAGDPELYAASTLRLSKLLKAGDQDGWTALHHAAAANCPAKVRMLCEAKADPCQAIAPHGLSPVHVAARRGHVHVLEALQQAGSPLTEQYQEHTPTSLSGRAGTNKLSG